jgi:hypothetical protein
MQWASFLPYYPIYGVLLLLFAVLIGMWLVFHVEKSRQLSWPKLLVATLLVALSSGVGLQLILVAAGM